MSDRAPIEKAKAILPMRALLDRLSPEWKKRNPLRADDRNNSFGANDHGWQDHGTGDKGDQITFLEKFETLGRGDAIRRFLEMAGVETATQNGQAMRSVPGRVITPQTPFEVAYPYHDANGTHVYDARRYANPKDFRPFNPTTGKLSLEGMTRVLYRLSEVKKAETVWIVEGEKDADNLAALNIVATCRAGGSSTWEPELTASLKGKDVIFCGDNDKPGREYCAKVEAALTPVVRSFRHVSVPEPHKDVSDYLEGMSDTEARAAIEQLMVVPDPMDVLLDARRLDISNPPAKPIPVLLLIGKPICTAGNITVVQALAKAGKTSFEAACIASLMNPSGDCLSVTGQNLDGFAVIHFDTEQSEYDHFEIIRQSLVRAGRPDLPEWLRSYHLADVPTKERRKALAHEMKRASIAGKLRAVFIDGGADLCVDPNDPAEAFGLVEEWHRLAITYHCPIIIILHENPGSLTAKTRGHLGSQLERKAETNLRLDKASDGVTTVFTERSRHCHIPKEIGPRFAWDEAAGMHVSCGSNRFEKEDAKAKEIVALVADVFKTTPLLSYTDLRAAIMQRRGIAQRSAEKYIAGLLPKFIQQTASGLYGVAT